MEKRKIVIVTEGFPYWEAENFLKNEISCLNDDFDIFLLPLVFPKNAQLQTLPENINVLEPILQRNYFVRFLQGIFNTSPILPFLRDFFNIFRDKKANLKGNFINWLTTMINSRALLASPQIKNLKKEVNTAIYLYWCNYPICLFGKFPNRIFPRVHGTEFAKINTNYISMHEYKLSMAENTIYLPISDQAADIIFKHTPVNYRINRLGVFSNKRYEGIVPDVIRIVSVAYMIPKKRIHLIIDSLKQIKGTKVEWFHFGNGPLFEKLKSQTDDLGDNINVKLMGFVSNKDILKFYTENYVDLFVNVSEIEGVPVSIMEALSFGIPVFATNVGGTGEIVSNENGYIAESNYRTEELSNFIINIRKTSLEKNLRDKAHHVWQEKSNAIENFNQLKKILNL